MHVFSNLHQSDLRPSIFEENKGLSRPKHLVVVVSQQHFNMFQIHVSDSHFTCSWFLESKFRVSHLSTLKLRQRILCGKQKIVLF